MTDLSLTFRGSTFGLDDATGYGWAVAGIDGLDLPGVRDGDYELAGDDGVGRNGRDLLDARTFVADLELVGEVEHRVIAEARQLAGVFAPHPDGAEEVLEVTIPGATYALVGRPRGARWAYRSDFHVEARVVFRTSRPWLYGTTERVATLALAGGALEGATFPVAAPLLFGTGGTSSTVALPNLGTAAAAPTIEIPGPVTNPAVEVVGSGTVKLAATVPDGTVAVVDVAARRVLLDGSPRYGWHRGDWPTIPPGGAAGRMTALSPDGSATIRYRDTYA